VTLTVLLLPELLLDLDARLARIGRSAGRESIVVRLNSVTDGTAALRMFGKTGAAACVGDRLTLVWRS
jgi:hypothetical protein